MPWVIRVKVVDGHDLLRYLSTDQELIADRASAKRFDNLAVAVETAKWIGRVGNGSFLVFVEKF